MARTDERTALRTLLAALDDATPELGRLVARRPRTGRLFGPLARHGLEGREVLLLLAALAARLEGRVVVSGNELAMRAGLDSAGRLEALARLTSEGRLGTSGLLIPEAPAVDGAAAQRTLYRLADHVFAMACEVFARQRTEREPAGPPTPYRSHRELLADLRRLSLLFRRRAARIFHLDPWSGAGLESTDGAGELKRRARVEAERVARRLELTPPSESMPLIALRSEHGLDLDSLVILVTMLFHEMLEGVGAIDAVDLIKLVSEGEDDLLRRRHLLRPLERRGLIELEGAYAGKDLTADASLPNAVVERLLGAAGCIGSDERIDFHAYLQRLDSSEPFFKEIEGGEDD